MPEFLSLVSPDKARSTLVAQLTCITQVETIPVINSLGRVLAEQVIAPHPLPEFRRSAVDGYAISARDSFGAGESLPAYLSRVGEVLMGASADFSLETGQCALIHTGGMVPEGADSVVMLEYTQIAGVGLIEVFRPVAVGENVIQIGEDVSRGESVIDVRRRIRPAEIGGLLALGIASVRVVKTPRIGILSSGDEIIHPSAQIKPGQVRDINAYSLSALVEEKGALPVRFGIVVDQEEALLEKAREALESCEMLVITAGSSASTRDLTVKVLAALGEPGVLVHGVQLRPGKPTILGVCAGKPVIGLPGNPVSALVSARLFILPAIDSLLGVRRQYQEATLQATLSTNLSSQAGREEWVPVKLIDQPDGQGYLAEPVYGKSNLIFTLVRADGLIRIPLAENGLEAGEVVDVYFL